LSIVSPETIESMHLSRAVASLALTALLLPVASVLGVLGSESEGALAIEDLAFDGTEGVQVFGSDVRDILGGGQWERGGLEIGDLNGDGLTEIMFSSKHADGSNNDRASAGDVYVLFGQEGGWDGTYDFATLPFDGSNGFVVHGGASGGHLGSDMRAGDINSDGFDDLSTRPPPLDSRLLMHAEAEGGAPLVRPCCEKKRSRETHSLRVSE